MPNPPPKLEWCIVRLGEDHNWWVDEISDPIHWDVDGLSIIDPRQWAHILDLLDPLWDYGFQGELAEAAFIAFNIDKPLETNRVRLSRSFESLMDSEEKLFALPNLLDDEKGPYADFLDHIAKLRVKFLNDAIDFEQRLTVEELEEEIREAQHNDFMEGRATHVFSEITDILEYVPAGYELDSEADEDTPVARTKKPAEAEDLEEEFPDVEEDENIEEDETMKWDEDEEDKEEEELDEFGKPRPPKNEGDDDLFGGDEDEDEEEEAEEEEEEKPKKRGRPRKKT